jgi:hypothetical protein
MNLYTKNQTLYILQKSKYIIGKELGKGYKITNIFVFPLLENFDFLLKEYIRGFADPTDIAQKYGKGQNLQIYAFSFEYQHLQVIVNEHIFQFLTQEMIDEIHLIE